MTTIHIIGIGAQTVLGRTAATTATSVGAGLSRLTVHPSVADKSGELVTVAMADFLPEDMPVVDRMVELALPAIHESLAPLARVRLNPETSVPLVLGLPFPRPGLSDTYEQEITKGIVRGLSGLGLIPGARAIAAGHNSGLLAIERAVQMIREGVCSLCLAAAVDSYLSPETLTWLDDTSRLRSSDNPSGFFPGEGAGALLLASDEMLRSLPSFGRVVAAANAQEPALELWERVLEGLPDERTISQTISDLNGQKFRTDEWSSSFNNQHHRFDEELSFLSPAMSFGDVGAASGTIFSAMMMINFELDGSQDLYGFVSTSNPGHSHACALIANEPDEGSEEAVP